MEKAISVTPEKLINKYTTLYLLGTSVSEAWFDLGNHVKIYVLCSLFQFLIIHIVWFLFFSISQHYSLTQHSISQFSVPNIKSQINPQTKTC